MQTQPACLSMVLLAAVLSACGAKSSGGIADGGASDAGAADAGSTAWLDDPGAAGFQIALPAVQVPAGAERVVCFFAEVPDVHNGGDVWSSRWQIAIDAHVHELIAYRVKTTVALDGEPGTLVTDGECLNQMNWADWPLVVNAQQRGDILTNVELPAGVGHRFQPHERLMVQVRLVNDSAAAVTGRAGINFYAPSQVPTMELGTIRASNTGLRVCQSNPTPTFNGSCQIDGSGVTVIGANGHEHSRGKAFSIYSWDGTSTTTPPESNRFYQSDAWDHPLTSDGLAVSLPANGGVWWTCGYQWSAPTPPVTCETLNSLDQMRYPGTSTDCCYVAGDAVQSAEQCTAFLYYYPKVDNVNCF